MAERNKVASRRDDEERRISPYTGHVLSVKAPRYDVLRPHDELRRSLSAHRDTTLFRSAVDIEIYWKFY